MEFLWWDWSFLSHIRHSIERKPHHLIIVNIQNKIPTCILQMWIKWCILIFTFTCDQESSSQSVTPDRHYAVFHLYEPVADISYTMCYVMCDLLLFPSPGMLQAIWICDVSQNFRALYCGKYALYYGWGNFPCLSITGWTVGWLSTFE